MPAMANCEAEGQQHGQPCPWFPSAYSSLSLKATVGKLGLTWSAPTPPLPFVLQTFLFRTGAQHCCMIIAVACRRRSMWGLGLFSGYCYI